MKLRNLVLGAALSLPLLAFADATSGNPFGGFYAGLGVGYTNNDVKADLSASGDSADQDFGKGGFAGQVLGGYNYGIDSNWLVGLDAFYSANAAKGTDTYVVDSENLSVTTQMNYNYGLDAIVGYAFNQTAMIYGGLGWTSTKFKISANVGGNGSINYNGWSAVGGAQQALTNCLSLRESVDYTQYKSKTLTFTGDSASLKPSQFTSMLSLIYTFNM